ncbi:hypothetical protein THRCLA_20613 [Thraustotheca clavata]|uniref:Ion transport domain-containing protein n=1 Tax=Thraustotheca clavata TaxID=74557 RepID=A0A1W0A5A1_9STRA|nr:hypothetical protein THRCLA_20613 [Thraustotheca clavata]
MTPLTFGIHILHQKHARIVELCFLAIIILNDILFIMALKKQFWGRRDRISILAFSILSVFNIVILENFYKQTTVKLDFVRSLYWKMYKVLARVQHIIKSSWQMLILLTTTNFPDVMMPAYNNSR